MRLTELDPRWLIKGGRRVWIIFRSPADPNWCQTRTFEALKFSEQCPLVWEAMADKAEEGRKFGQWQRCEPLAWKCSPDPQAATFDNISIMPSIDGSRAHLWHGFITNGQIVGGI